MRFRCGIRGLDLVGFASHGEQLSGGSNVDVVVKLAGDPEPGSTGEFSGISKWPVPLVAAGICAAGMAVMVAGIALALGTTG